MLADERRAWQGALVAAKPTPMAGGFFWMAAILVGAVWGVAAGNPMKGILIGTGVGAAIAAAVWLIDRRKRKAG